MGVIMETLSKAERRHEAIKDLLIKNDVYFIDDFCNTLNVSEATIRNDLTFLESQGKLRRIKGGALATISILQDSVFSKRSVENIGEKQKIAKYVVDHIITEGMRITLDSGSTCLAIAEAIVDRKLKCSVITNSFSASRVLAKIPQVDLYLAGGRYNRQNDSFRDEQTTASMSTMFSDIFFLSADGVDADSGITTFYNDESFIKFEMIKQAKKVVVVSDYSKIGKVGLKLLCNINKVARIIVDDKIDEEEVLKFKQANIQIDIVK